MRNPGNKGFYRCDITGRTYPEKGKNRSFWASHLEYQVHERMSAAGLNPIVRQWQLPIAKGCYGLPDATWDVDFILPNSQLIVEAKGRWINNKSATAEKYKFLLQVRCAVEKGYTVLVVGFPAFKIGKLEVHDYKKYDWSKHA